MIYLISATIYLAIGVAKLKFFDLNGEGDWLIMWADSRNRRSGLLPLYFCVFLCWLSWPIVFVSRKKIKKVDDEVFQHDEHGNCSLVKTGLKRYVLVAAAPVVIARSMFHLQWAGKLGLKARKQ